MASKAQGNNSTMHKSSWIPMSSDLDSSGKPCRLESNDEKTETLQEEQEEESGKWILFRNFAHFYPHSLIDFGENR